MEGVATDEQQSIRASTVNIATFILQPLHRTHRLQAGFACRDMDFLQKALKAARGVGPERRSREADREENTTDAKASPRLFKR